MKTEITTKLSFYKGFKAMLPITTGIFPFGTVMGTVCFESGLDLTQTFLMNLFVFGGASQLASIDLLLKDTESIIIIFTGIMINFRFILYSAALSPLVINSSLLTKIVSAYLITDQNYAVMSANSDKLDKKEIIPFYLGASICMFLTWHSSVIAGFIFGNFAPKELALDFAIPLSFLALTMPALKNKLYIFLAICSSVLAIILKTIPYNLGLILTALIVIGLGTFLTRKPSKI